MPDIYGNIPAVGENIRTTFAVSIRPLAVAAISLYAFYGIPEEGAVVSLDKLVTNPEGLTAISILGWYSLDCLTTLWKTVGANRQLREQQSRGNCWD